MKNKARLIFFYLSEPENIYQFSLNSTFMQVTLPLLQLTRTRKKGKRSEKEGKLSKIKQDYFHLSDPQNGIALVGLHLLRNQFPFAILNKDKKVRKTE